MRIYDLFLGGAEFGERFRAPCSAKSTQHSIPVSTTPDFLATDGLLRLIQNKSFDIISKGVAPRTSMHRGPILSPLATQPSQLPSSHCSQSPPGVATIGPELQNSVDSVLAAQLFDFKYTAPTETPDWRLIHGIDVHETVRLRQTW
jgi:hypothetical protein